MPLGLDRTDEAAGAEVCDGVELVGVPGKVGAAGVAVGVSVAVGAGGVAGVAGVAEMAEVAEVAATGRGVEAPADATPAVADFCMAFWVQAAITATAMIAAIASMVRLLRLTGAA
jgi:hypothetical protein